MAANGGSESSELPARSALQGILEPWRVYG